ncbi:hypothetical protein CEXT_623061 [Caerostris extrusa]|uniref:Uncharacterized protein n=1 Tax=Caerostris extrusa TaxID=172846 RepID=A0AAV4MZG6_CAEEX|nr:hypothetical protein CEXT_623061 [Caerostris extrusa]
MADDGLERMATTFKVALTTKMLPCSAFEKSAIGEHLDILPVDEKEEISTANNGSREGVHCQIMSLFPQPQKLMDRVVEQDALPYC